MNTKYAAMMGYTEEELKKDFKKHIQKIAKEKGKEGQAVLKGSEIGTTNTVSLKINYLFIIPFQPSTISMKENFKTTGTAQGLHLFLLIK